VMGGFSFLLLLLLSFSNPSCHPFLLLQGRFRVNFDQKSPLRLVFPYILIKEVILHISCFLSFVFVISSSLNESVCFDFLFLYGVFFISRLSAAFI